MLWLVVVSSVCLVSVLGDERRGNTTKKNDFQYVDVEGISRGAYGTELILLENSLQDQKTYRFEDFFWTGSGDGPPEGNDNENPWNIESSTIYKTKTIISTVYIETPSTSSNETSDNSTKCIYNCELPITIDEEINPTKTYSSTDPSTEGFFDADQQFWLLTVLKSDGKDPVITDLKNSLAKLYKTAFQRQQERHLGINNRIKREPVDKPINVYIHKLEKNTDNGDENIQVLYHVSVSGKPVSAITAADDMSLVSDEEVQQELGYPFLIKAEPYLKASQPQSLSKAKGTWVIIGVSLVGVLMFLLIVAFITLGLAKKKRQSTTGLENRRHIFERGVAHGQDNKGNQPSGQTIRSKAVSSRPGSSFSSSSSSSASLDISPLMGLSKQRTPPRKPPRPKAAINKTVPLNVKRISADALDSDSVSSRKDSPDAILVDNYDPGVMSPKSYLSMPSVKSFPRGNMPEPLNKVLEPVSVLHLDMPDDDMYASAHAKDKRLKPNLSRHASVGAVADPGVIGPIVWNMHCQRLQHGVSVDEGIDDLKIASNVSKMRKRFHDILDDTFSLFGSRRASPVDDQKSHPIEVKSHSAVEKRPETSSGAPTPKPRPKTTDSRKVFQSPGSSGPRGAWASSAPSPLVRPLSAGIIRPPKVNVDHILAEGKFRANDPAIPLIAAIRTEIEKCSLPGSTTDLKQ